MGITYVLLGSQRPDVGDAIRPFSRLVRMPEQEVRNLFTTHGPRLFRAYHRRAEAQGLANQIRALGLKAAILTLEDILDYAFVAANQLNIGQGGISGVGEGDGAFLFIPFSDVAAVIRGDVSEMSGDRKVLTPMPGETKIRHEFLKELCVDLHRKSVPMAVRVRKSKFHMNPIVAGESVEGPFDLDRFIRIVVQRAPLAVFDDGFSRSSEAVDFSLRLLDAGEPVAIPARSGSDDRPQTPAPLPSAPEREEGELTSLPSFDLYSTLWRFQAIVE